MTKADLSRHEALIQRLLSEVSAHPSQVVATVRHLLGVPVPALMDMLRSGRQDVLSRIGGIREGGWQVIEHSAVIRGQRAFVLRPGELHAVEIVDCHDFLLDLTQVRQAFDMDGRAKFVITIRNCRNFMVRGGSFARARNVCIIENSESFSISRLNASHTEGYGVIVFNSRVFEIRACNFIGGLASGVYCLGNTSNGWIHENVFRDGSGHFNWDAGLHINHCSPEVRLDDVPEMSHEDKRIVDKTLKPSLLYVENNLVSRNRSQGIYCEGAVLCCFESNTLSGNNKEGICFDWGSALNLFHSNTVIENGERARLSEAEIRADFIEHHPLLADGSSSCKLPGVSIDNGAVNFIVGNRIQANSGSGIKMVRTGVGNLLLDNAILDNGVGKSEFFPGFGAVYYLAMGAGPSEFHPADAKLDFYPSAHNLCAGNTFRVDEQDPCIAHDALSADNVESGNVRML